MLKPIATFLCLLCPFFIIAQQSPIFIDKEDTFFPVVQHSVTKEDKTWKLGLSDVQKDNSFVTPSHPDFFEVGGSDPRNMWIKFQVENQTSKEIYLELSLAITDTTYLYSVSPQNEITVQQMGKYLNFNERLVKNNHQVFLLNGKKDELTTYYLNIRCPFPLSVRTRIGTHNAFLAEFHRNDLLHGCFIGIFLIIILFNVLFFISTREIFYAYYTGYAVFIMFSPLRFDGYLFEFLYPNYPFLNNLGFYFHGLAGIFGIYFSRGFLQTKIYTPLLDKGLVYFIGLYALNIGLAVTGFYELNIKSVYYITFPFNSFIIFIGIQVYRHGFPIARFFISGTLCLTIGIAVFMLYNYGVISDNIWTRNAMYIGIAVQSTLFFMAMVDRYRILQKEKEDAQRVMIESLQQNEQLIIEKNRLLEENIHDRVLELELMQSKLADFAQKLIKSNQELTDFAHIASHDLRAPIRNIGSFAQLLERRIDPLLDARSKEYFGYIKTNVQQSTKLIEDLLNYSKIDKNIGEPQPVDLNDVLVLVTNNLQSFMLEKKAKIIASNLPILRGHSSLFIQLFQNLINNGLIYNKSETPTISISVDCQEHDMVFKIADNGIGIPPQYKTHIFGMFQRLHASQDYEGSGIGLAFCERIVSTYHGRIWLESEEGKGSTFFFTLPDACK